MSQLLAKAQIDLSGRLFDKNVKPIKKMGEDWVVWNYTGQVGAFFKCRDAAEQYRLNRQSEISASAKRLVWC